MSMQDQMDPTSQQVDQPNTQEILPEKISNQHSETQEELNSQIESKNKQIESLIIQVSEMDQNIQSQAILYNQVQSDLQALKLQTDQSSNQAIIDSDTLQNMLKTQENQFNQDKELYGLKIKEFQDQKSENSNLFSQLQEKYDEQELTLDQVIKQLRMEKNKNQEMENICVQQKSDLEDLKIQQIQKQIIDKSQYDRLSETTELEFQQFNKTIQTMQDDKQESMDQLQKVKEQNIELHIKIDELNLQILSWQEKSFESKQLYEQQSKMDADKLEQLNQDLNSKIIELNIKLQKCMDKESNQNESEQEFNNQQILLKNMLQTLSAENESQSQRINDSSEVIERSKHDLNIKLELFQEEKVVLSDRIKVLESNEDLLKKQVTDINQELLQVKDLNKSTNDQFEEIKKQLDSQKTLKNNSIDHNSIQQKEADSNNHVKVDPDAVQEQDDKIKALVQDCQQKQNQISSLQDEIQNIKAQAGQASEGKKMVQISVDELVKWDKRSKDLMSQIKNLQLENQKLKLDLEQKEKLQNSKQIKNELSLEGLQERCKALQHIIDSSSFTNAKYEKQVINLQEQNSQIKEDYQAQENEIKQLREISKQKFKLETELTQCQAHIDDLRTKTRDMQNTHVKLDQVESDLILVTKSGKQSEMQKQKFQKLYEENYVQLQESLQLRDKLLSEKETSTSKLRDFERMIAQQFKDVAELEANNKEYTQVIEDLKSQVKIMARKNAAEVCEIRNEWAKHQESNKLLLEENKNLQGDLQILRDNSFRRSSVVVDDKKIDKKEKIILESLSSRVNEVELENHKLRGRIQWLEQQLDGKKNYILALMAELTKNNPTLLEDMQILDSEDIKVLEKYRQNDPQILQILLEKLMIENVQLREQIKILGIELNQMFQKQRQG